MDVAFSTTSAVCQVGRLTLDADVENATPIFTCVSTHVHLVCLRHFTRTQYSYKHPMKALSLCNFATTQSTFEDHLQPFTSDRNDNLWWTQKNSQNNEYNLWQTFGGHFSLQTDFVINIPYTYHMSIGQTQSSRRKNEGYFQPMEIEIPINVFFIRMEKLKHLLHTDRYIYK